MKTINKRNYRSPGLPAIIRQRLCLNLLSLLVVLIVAIVSMIMGHL